MTSSPRTLGRYALIGPLGPSRKAALAWDPDARRMVVITTPRQGVDPARFVAAALSAARFSHPRIAAILAVEEHDGVPFMVSAFVRGHAVTVGVRTPTHTALVPALHQMADLCDTLAFAHERGLLYRPFSPHDVIVDRDGDVVLVGTGIVSDTGGVPDEPALATEVGALLYALVTATTSARTSGREAARVPIAIARPDLEPEAAAFIDAWAAGRYRQPLTQCAADLRALAARAALPRLATPVNPANPANPVSLSIREERGLVLPIESRLPPAHHEDAGSALDVFKSEVTAEAKAEVMTGAEPTLSAAPLLVPAPAHPDRHWPSRPIGVAAALVVVALAGFLLWRFLAPSAEPPTADVRDGAPPAAHEGLSDTPGQPRGGDTADARAQQPSPGAAATTVTVEVVDMGEPPSPATRTPGTPTAVAAPRAIQPPEALSKVDPEYPHVARQSGILGDVVVDLVIASDGRITSTAVVSGPAILRGAAQAALRQWRFRPATLNGTPLATVRRFRVSFGALPATAPTAASVGIASSPDARLPR